MNREPRRVRRPRPRGARATSSAAPARPRSVCGCRSTPRARCWPRATSSCRGYWEQPEQTADAIHDGWFHTGDGGDDRRRELPAIADRKKDVIISGGENVSSIEVEDCIFSHPAVAEVAVVGVPHEKWGETVKALVVLAPGATLTEARPDRALPRAPDALQVPDVGRVPGRARPHGDRQAPEVQAPRRRTGKAARSGSTRAGRVSSTRNLTLR